ncbi:MAG: hypothetical protein JSS81_04500 [Acidobacteria bacterium]|nr:hypothetical protein [Acidobacteriota bacterium]
MAQNDKWPGPRNHSRLGIASTVIGILLPVLLILFVVAGVFLGTRKGTVGNSIMVVLLIVSLTFPFLHLLGLIFGLIGLFSKTTKKAFPVIGTLLNALLLTAAVLIVVFTFENLKFPT